jgi:hypothetical protein
MQSHSPLTSQEPVSAANPASTDQTLLPPLEPQAEGAAVVVPDDGKANFIKMNQENMDEIIKLVIAYYPKFAPGEVISADDPRILGSVDIINQRLAKDKLIFSMVAGYRLMAILILRIIFKKIDPATNQPYQAETGIDGVMKDYADLENAATLAQRNMYNQGNNISRWLMQGSYQAHGTLGDDLDIRWVLDGLISDPDARDFVFKSNQDYILPATSLVASGREAVFVDPIENLSNRIKRAIECSGDGENIKLHIPVNRAQIHWLLFNVTISKGKVIEAEVVDSYSGGGLGFFQSADAKQAQQVIDAVNKNNNVKVKSTFTGRQHDGHTCMDHVIQRALQVSRTIDIRERPTLVALRDEKNGDALRPHVLKIIAANNPEVKVAMANSKAGIPAAPAATPGFGGFKANEAFSSRATSSKQISGYTKQPISPCHAALLVEEIVLAVSDNADGLKDFTVAKFFQENRNIRTHTQLVRYFKNGNVPVEHLVDVATAAWRRDNVPKRFGELLTVVEYLPIDARGKFIQQYISYKQNENKNYKQHLGMDGDNSGRQLEPVLMLLNIDDQRSYIEFVFHSYVDTYNKLEECMSYLSEDTAYDYMMYRYDLLDTAEKAIRMMTLVPEDQMLDYVSKVKPFINSIADIKNLLAHIKSDEIKYEVIQSFKERMTLAQDVKEILEVVPQKCQFEFLCDFEAIVTQDQGLTEKLYAAGWANKRFKDDHLNEVTSWRMLEFILSKYPEGQERNDIIVACINNINEDASYLHRVISLFPPKDRAAIVEHCSSQVSVANIDLIISELPQSHHEAFLAKHADKTDSYVMIIKHLTPEMQFKLVNSKMAKFNLVKQPHAPLFVVDHLHPSIQKDYDLTGLILLHIDRYLDHSVVFHRERVVEMRNAVTSAASFDEVCRIVSLQSRLMQNSNASDELFSQRQYHFLNRAPGKRSISVGYKSMLASCMNLTERSRLEPLDVEPDSSDLDNALRSFDMF